MDEQRRILLGAGIAVGATLLLPACATTATTAPIRFDPIPPLPETPTPGRPGDFDFLTGEWRIHHWQRRGGNEWIEFEGEATVTAILAGIGSVEELRIPERNFSGMGLRLLDVEKRVWSDFWVNARSGVLTTPGQTGSFEDGSGIFVTDDVENGQPVKYAGVWDSITPTNCRWRQAASHDGGKSWEQSWIMSWTRVTGRNAAVELSRRSTLMLLAGRQAIRSR